MARYYKEGKKVYDTSTKKWLSPEKSQHYADISGGWQYLPDYVAPTTQPTPTPTPTTPKPTQTPTPTPTAPAGQPQTAQGGYAGLTNKGGTIYLGDKAFSSPADLATHLGIQPHEINWGNIPQAPTAQPTQANYEGLENRDGTIYLGNTAFKDPTKLAQHLGIQPHEIDWGQIPQGAEPTTVTTTDELRAEQTEDAKPYIKYADSDKVFDRDDRHITAEQAADIPDFWNNVQMSGETRPEGLKTPIERIQDAFGDPNWQPSAAFTPELQAQGIYGAVKIGDKVWTIGEGGGEESAASYKDKFGREITDTAGIAGEVDIATAIKLGINVDANTIIDPIIPIDPYEVWEHFRDEDKKEIETLQKTLTDATLALIETMKDFGEDKAKDEEKEKLKMEEKSQAIADAQTAANDLTASYDKLINNERFKGRGMIQITGRQAKLRSMKAVELSPLLINVSIAQGSYDRAFEELKLWSDEYNFNMEMQMNAAKLNIDMISGQLTQQQQENLAEAQIKFNIWTADYNKKLETQSEVRKLMLLYPEANVSIADSWEDAYHKISPYIKNEKDFEKKLRLLEARVSELKVTEAETAFIEGQIGKRTGGSRSWRNNNPGNIEYGDFAKSMGAIGTDGRFAIFPDETTGWTAMETLLQGKNYRNLTVDAAMKRWSGQGYGGEVAGTRFVQDISGRTMNNLSKSELKALMDAMRVREGWTIGEVGDVGIVEDYFTSTQINKGATNAGMSIEAFKQLDPNVANSYINPTKEEFLSEKNMRKIAIAAVKKMDVEDAMKYIQTGTIKISGKEKKLTQSQINLILNIIAEEYPEGRTFLQKLLPFGK